MHHSYAFQGQGRRCVGYNKQCVDNTHIPQYLQTRFFPCVHCGSAIRFVPGVSGLPYYSTPLVCVSAIVGGLVVLWHDNNKLNKRKKEQFLASVITSNRWVFTARERKKERSLWSLGRILSDVLFLGLMSISHIVWRCRFSAAPEAVMQKVDWRRTAVVLIYTCHRTCASEHSLCLKMCENGRNVSSFWGHLRGLQLGRAMNWVDLLRTSADEGL